MIEKLLSLVPGVGPASAVLRFLTSSIGVGILAAAIGFGFGYQTADHKADLDKARAEIVVLHKDIDTAKGAAALAKRQSGTMEAKLKTNQERVNALERDLKRSPLGACSLSNDAARRLRDIR